MATGEPRSVRQQKRSISKSISQEGQTADVTCRCRGCKKTLCCYCKNSPKKFKFLKGTTTKYQTDGTEAVGFPTVVTPVGGSRSGSRYWHVNFNEYFINNFQKMLEIKPGVICLTIRYVKEKIWVPAGNSIKVYNTTGTNLKTIDIKSPISIEKAFNGDIFIACYNNCGLYVIDENEAPQKICDGNFAHVYAYRYKVYALECAKKLIIECCCRPETTDVRLRWSCEKEWRVDEAGYNDKLIVTGDEDLQFYVSHRNRHKLGLYNIHGQCIRQFGGTQETGDGNLNYPWLCGIDKQSHLLVADWGNKVYKILDPGTGQWKSTEVRGETYVYDATLDDEGNLWLCQHNGKEYIITKHEPQ